MDPNKNNTLKKYIENRKEYIQTQYTIVSRYEDGCDHFGLKYWITCENGRTYRCWQVNGEKRKQQDNLYKDISNGFSYTESVANKKGLHSDTLYYFNIPKLNILFKSC